MTIKKLIIAAALSAPAAVAFTAPAHAQAAGGIATADPTVAIARTKALAAANEQIRNTFKDNLTKIEAKAGDRQRVLAQLDKNGDKQVDDNELATARTAKNPALTQLDQIEAETNQLTTPVLRAQAFAIEMILQQYAKAQTSVVTSKKISVILTPEAFVYAPESADVTGAITTQLDTIVPSVPITAPQNWNPTEETMQILQRIQRMTQYAMALAAAQRGQGGAPAPAAGGARPAAATTRPATVPARPATTPTTQPQSR
jgi:Skp family chaperone for outer membrane proteins